MDEEQTLLVDLLKKAVNLVYQEERLLFNFEQGEREGLEQAFVFRTGVHLSKLLTSTQYALLDLDSEYNKNHGNKKTSTRFQNGIRPDLLIHRRDSDKENKLVAEFKGWWNNDDNNKDIKKLQDLTDPNGNYHYLIGVFVLIENTNSNFQYFINGKEREEI